MVRIQSLFLSTLSLLLLTACPWNHESSLSLVTERTSQNEKVHEKDIEKPKDIESPKSLPSSAKPKKTKYTTEFWDGNQERYCRLHLLNPVQALHERIDGLLKKGHYQEAIWLLEERGPQKRLEARKLKEKLTRLFTEGHYKVLPKQIGGSTKKMLLEFDGGVLGLFKYSHEAITRDFWWADEKAEVAAYHLDQLLQANVVPLTVLRRIDGEEGSIQYYFSDAEAGNIDQTASRNFATLKVFDYLTGNTDRNVSNFLYWADEDRSIGIDNGAGFKEKECGNPEDIKKFLELMPTLKARMNKIRSEEVEQVLSPYFSQDIIRSVIRRLTLLQDNASS